MCGIIGACNKENASQVVATGLEKIQERGRDASGYWDGKVIHSTKGIEQSKTTTILGHVLHAIVDVIPQPLEKGKNILIANCEIYNWKELKGKFALNVKNDAELLLHLLNTIGVEKTIEEIQGVYAFAYKTEEKIFLVRDIIGVKPLWYSYNGKSLLFCSEKKGIEAFTQNIVELNPRIVLEYNEDTQELIEHKREFLNLSDAKEENALPKLKELLKRAIESRIPQQKFALLFSGGLDSTIIAKMLKDLGKEFTCYVAGTSDNAPDVIAAKEIAKELDLTLKVTIVPKEGVEDYIRRIAPLIEDNNVVKIGVALPLYIAAQQAKKDGNKVIFSGSGADELFAGYARYKEGNLKDLNKDCFSDILKIYEKNCYRDDVITMNNNLELRVPFLDKEVVEFALNIAPEEKIKNGIDKYILRKLAEEIGISKAFAQRKKKAAQYGSGFDKAIEKLARPQKKSAYLKQFYTKANLKLGALISSGKDGWFAAYTMHKQNYNLSCIISLKSTNKESYMFHTPNVDVVKLQAEAANLPLILQETEGEKEKELQDLAKAIQHAKEEYGIEGIITGALYSNYQRERIEKVAESLGLKVFSPLWHIDQEYELRELLRKGFSIVLSSIAADGLNASWLGREITEKDVDKLVALHKKIGFNVAGEGGEYESLVLDCPLFQKKIMLKEKEIREENKYTAQLLVHKAILS